MNQYFSALFLIKKAHNKIFYYQNSYYCLPTGKSKAIDPKFFHHNYKNLYCNINSLK